MRLVVVLAGLLVLLAPHAVAGVPAPTRHAPIVVGGTPISRGALEARTADAREWLFERELSRQAAAASLIAETALREQARRDGLRVRGRSVAQVEVAVGQAIGGRGGDARRFVARFRAFERRWHAGTRCTPYWSVTVPCLSAEAADQVPCLWTGATEICTATPDPPEEPFWSVHVVAERFGGDSDASFPVERALRRRIARIRGLRARLGDILNEGEISVFALDEGAAAIVAREAYLLQRARLARRAR